MASSSKVWQVLARSNRLYQSLLKTVYACTHISTTKNHNYLTIRFSCYFFLFFTQCFILYKSYTLRFKQNLYYSFKSTLKSLCALILYYINTTTLKMVNELESAILTTKNYNYLIIRFLHYSFYFFYAMSYSLQKLYPQI